MALGPCKQGAIVVGYGCVEEITLAAAAGLPSFSPSSVTTSLPNVVYHSGEATSSHVHGDGPVSHTAASHQGGEQSCDTLCAEGTQGPQGPKGISSLRPPTPVTHPQCEVSGMWPACTTGSHCLQVPYCWCHGPHMCSCTHDHTTQPTAKNSHVTSSCTTMPQ